MKMFGSNAIVYPGWFLCSFGNTSGIVATPVLWLSIPVKSMARLGEHNVDVLYCVNNAPFDASASMLGVFASPP